MQAEVLNNHLVAWRHRVSGGVTIVFANGPGCDQSVWDDVIAALGGGFGTLTHDMRGHGHSGMSDAFGVGDLAADLIALLTHLGLGNVILCGASLGAIVAAKVAVLRPDLVAGLVLCHVAGRPVGDECVDAAFSPDFRRDHPARVAAFGTMVARSPGCAAAKVALAEAQAATGIAVPTLCVTGAEDPWSTPDDIRAVAAAIPDARAIVLDSIGHLSMIEAPKRIAALIEEIAAPAASRFEIGMQARRSVLGDAHVARAEAAKTALDTPFQTLITESAWGTVWASPGISRRERSMITLALLAATGNFDEIPMHVRATRATGASARDIAEAFQHVAIYAGVPRANHALKLARQTLKDMESEDG